MILYKIHSQKESAAALDRITPNLKLESKLIGVGMVSWTRGKTADPDRLSLWKAGPSTAKSRPQQPL